MIDRKAMGRLKSEILWIFHTITLRIRCFPCWQTGAAVQFMKRLHEYIITMRAACYAKNSRSSSSLAVLLPNLLYERRDLALFLVKTVYYLTLKIRTLTSLFNEICKISFFLLGLFVQHSWHNEFCFTKNDFLFWWFFELENTMKRTAEGKVSVYMRLPLHHMTRVWLWIKFFCSYACRASVYSCNLK